MTIETSKIIPTNRNALISLIAAILTLLSFCIAVAPIPFTGYVCFPAAAIFGLVALVAGVTSLQQIRSSRENGRGYALIGVWIGGLAMVASACAIASGILLLPQIVNFIRQVSK